MLDQFGPVRANPEPVRTPPARFTAKFVPKTRLQCSHTGFEKPHETALELVYRAENRCKSIGARAGGLFQAFLGPMWARKGPKT